MYPVTGTCAEIAEKKLSLANCIEIALNNSTSPKKAEYNMKLRGADVLRNYGSFLPRLSVSAGYSPYTLNRTYSVPYSYPYTTAQIFKTTQKSVNLTLTTSLNLFNGFRDYASLQASLNQEHSAEYTLARALESVVYDVTQSYYQVLLNQELLDISRENLLAIQDQLILTDRQFKVGLKSLTDLYQQQADVEQSRLSVNKAETRLYGSMFELVRRLRIDPQTKLSLVQDIKEMKTPASKPDIDSLVAIALERRYDLKSRSLEKNAAKWELTGSRASWYPSLDLNANISTGGVEYLRQEYSYPSLSEQLGHAIGYSVALSLNWSLFDGFQTHYAVQAAKINLINQQLDYDDLKKDIVIDIHQAAEEYASAFIQIETAKVSFTAARSAYEAIKRKYELGAASFVEISTARATLFNAQSNLSQATYNLALQKSVLDFSTGNIAIP